MEKELFQNGQPILTNDLLNSQGDLEDSLTKRFTDSFSPGILEGSLNQFAVTINASNSTLINVATGVAYDSLGNRISITSATDVYVAPYVVGPIETSGIPFTDGVPNGPLTTTNNGIGGYTSTPQNSGCYGIPLFPQPTPTPAYFYVWIGYLQTTDPTIFVLQNLTNLRLFTSANDGYQIKIVESPTIVANPSTLNPDQTNFSYVYLGYVDNTGIFPVVNNSGLTYYSLENDRLLAMTPDLAEDNKTLVYGLNQTVDLDQHVKACGHGIVNPSNPHGMELADLSNVGVTVAQLLETSFTSGISGNNTSALSYTIDAGDIPGNPTWGVNAFIVAPLVVGQPLEVNGVVMDTTSALGFTTEFFMSSSSGTILPTDTYTVYVDSLSQTMKLAALGPGAGATYQVAVNAIYSAGTTVVTSSVTGNPNDFSLWSFSFNHGTGVISSVVDLRLFGNISSVNLSSDSATNTFDINHNVDITGNLNVTGTITGTIVGAENLDGGTAWSIPYQSAPSTTAFTTPAGTTAQVLTATTGAAPTWNNLPLKYYSSVRANGTSITVTVPNPTAISWVPELATTPAYTPGTTFKSIEVYITYSSSELATPGNGSVYVFLSYPTAGGIGGVNTFTANYPAYGIYLNVNSSYSLSFYGDGNSTTVDVGFLLVGTV